MQIEKGLRGRIKQKEDKNEKRERSNAFVCVCVSVRSIDLYKEGGIENMYVRSGPSMVGTV